MVAVHVYIEGGGDKDSQQSVLREGFAKLIAKIGLKAKPKLKVCGSRIAAFEQFKNALKSHPDAICILLVDSEGPMQEGSTTWEHVRMRKGDQWSPPKGVTDSQLYLMDQAMEAWLIADPEALAVYYGHEFRRGALPGEKNIELIAKCDINDALERATRETKKGKYEKKHGWSLIALVDPVKVRAASWHAARFFDTLRDHLG